MPTKSVYVVELDKKVLESKKFREANPEYVEGKPCVYVGMTGLTPEQRFENHLNGNWANGYVRRFGIRLRPKLYEQYNPMTNDEAKKKEVWLAERLRRKGYAVWQN